MTPLCNLQSNFVAVLRVFPLVYLFRKRRYFRRRMNKWMLWCSNFVVLLIRWWKNDMRCVYWTPVTFGMQTENYRSLFTSHRTGMDTKAKPQSLEIKTSQLDMQSGAVIGFTKSIYKATIYHYLQRFICSMYTKWPIPPSKTLENGSSKICVQWFEHILAYQQINWSYVQSDIS